MMAYFIKQDALFVFKVFYDIDDFRFVDIDRFNRIMSAGGTGRCVVVCII